MRRLTVEVGILRMRAAPEKLFASTTCANTTSEFRSVMILPKMGFYPGNDSPLDFLCSLMAPAHYMRFYVKQAAHAVMSSAAYRKSRSDATLQRFGVWGIQRMLKLLHELCHMQAICKSVVCMDRYRHGAAAVRFGNFAEGDAGRGVGVGKVP